MKYSRDHNDSYSWVAQEEAGVYDVKSRFDFIEQMKSRTETLVIDCLLLCDELPLNKNSTRIISYQLGKSASSVVANYRASCRARSGKELFSKISLTAEEADETVYWLEVLKKGKFLDSKKLEVLILESTQILKIVATARKNSKKHE